MTVMSIAPAPAEPKPTATYLDDFPDLAIFRELRNRRQWLGWDYRLDEASGRWTKPPINPINGYNMGSTHRHKMTMLSVALTGARRNKLAGVGLAIFPDDEYTVIDLDKCRDPDTGALEPWAAEIVALNECYWEASPSGKGLRSIVRGKLATYGRAGAIKNDAACVEAYDFGRYVTITGRHLPGTPGDILPAPRTIAALIVRSNEIKPALKLVDGTPQTAPRAAVKRSGDDFFGNVNETTLANLDRFAPAMFGARAEFQPGTGAYRVKSLNLARNLEEDLSLSPLGIRDFGDEVGLTAIDCVMKFRGVPSPLAAAFDICSMIGVAPGELGYAPPRVVSRQLDDAHYARKAEQRAENVKLVEDDLAGDRITRLMTLDDMAADLVWLSAGRYTGRISDKRVMKSEDFAALLGASKTLIEPKSDRGQPKLVPTFSLWRESRERATVDAQTWLPEGPTFCPLPVPSANNGMQGFNTWAELPAYAAPENWLELSAPFREHLDYLCPVPAERDHFTMWLAHIFQKPGVLPHHFFCHVTTTHGIGRNWLASVLVRMLRRYVAPDLDMEQVLEGKYNDQMSKKLLLIFNEVYEPGGAARHRRGAKLRELVNPEYRHVNPKCERQHAEYNFARWLCFSNFEEAIAFDTEDNRLVIIENPSLRQADSYYERLYTAYKDPAFLASCRHWLQTIDISAFNPGRYAGVNDIKRRSLEAQTSPADLAAQQFVKRWPGSWVGVKFFKTAVSKYLHEIEGVERVDENDLRYAMKRAGVTSTQRLMRLPELDKIATVKGRCSREALMGAEAFELQQQWREWVAVYAASSDG